MMTMDQIIKLQTSNDYKDRLKAEFNLLLRREEKLAKMLNHYSEKDTNCPKQLLCMQHEIMCRYLDILVVRAKLEGVDLNG